MSVLTHGLRPPMQRPPLGALIDWSHPISNGLIFAAPFNDMLSTTVNSVVSAQRGVFTGSTGPSWGSIDGEQALIFPSGSTPPIAYLDYGLDRGTELTSTIPWTLMFRVYLNSTNGLVMGRSDANNDTGWSVNVTSLGVFTLNYIGGSGNGLWRSTKGVAIGGWTTVAFVDSAGTGAAGTVACYIDGTDWGLGAHSPVGSPHLAPISHHLYLGRGGDFGSPSLDGALSFVYMWSRALGAGEVQTLSAQPYAIFADPLRAVYDEMPVFLAGSTPPGGYVFPALTVAA